MDTGCDYGFGTQCPQAARLACSPDAGPMPRQVSFARVAGLRTGRNET